MVTEQEHGAIVWKRTKLVLIIAEVSNYFLSMLSPVFVEHSYS